MSEREYFVRGKRVTVEEVPGVVGVKLDQPAQGLTAPAYRAVAANSLGGEATVQMSDIEREAFSQAGWVFVRPPPALRGATAIRAAVGASDVGRVFRHPSGHTLIGSDRLTVKLRPDLSQDETLAILAREGLEVVRELRFAPNLYEVQVPPGRDFLDVAVELQQRKDFVYAEPEMIQHVEPRLKPMDPDYSRQWQWHNDGSAGGIAEADIHVETAWDITRGEGVRIAIIDNGFDVTHPDLASAIGRHAGFFRDMGAGNSVFVAGLKNFPDNNHGTFCAGIAAARANNGEGGCGVAHEAELMLVACLGDQIGTQATLARAIAYAAEPQSENDQGPSNDGASVIACSLGPNGADWQLESVLEDGLSFAVQRGRGGLGVPVFWAVSNGDVPVSADEVCSHPATIAVGRSTRRDTEDGSAYGPELSFLAPGVEVYSTASGGGYRYSTGASFAAPCAAGIAALMLAVKPTLTWEEVRQIMQDTCDKVGGATYGPDGRHDRYGYGRVNAARAVRAAGQEV